MNKIEKYIELINLSFNNAENNISKITKDIINMQEV
jgi:hypothetical protein